MEEQAVAGALGSLPINITIAVVAWLLHGAMKWQEFNDRVRIVGPVGYVKTVPARVTSSLLASLLVFLVSYEMGWLNPLSSLGAGYMANSVVDNFVKRLGLGKPGE